MSDGAVEAYRAGLEPATREAVDALRALAAEAHPGLTETIKWNAPNFAVDGEDRITLGVAPKGGVRAVLHRGAQASVTSGFAFADPERLAKWPAADRGVIQFKSKAEMEARREALSDLFARWLAATA